MPYKRRLPVTAPALLCVKLESAAGSDNYAVVLLPNC